MSSSHIDSLDHIASVAQDATLEEAAKAMRTDRVGFLVVVDADGAPVGALTDRDLALRAVAWKKEPDSPVSEVMSTPLETLTVDSTREDQIKRMAALGIRRIPIVDGDKVVGVVSLDDLSCELSEELHGLSEGTARKIQRERKKARREELFNDAEEALAAVRNHLRYANWMTREQFLDQLDEIRKGVSDGLKGKAI